MPSTQTPEYTVRIRTPHEHHREKETPEPLTSAKASGEGILPTWRSPAVECSFVVQALMAHRRAPSRVTVGDEPSMNSHETREVAVSQPARTMLGCARAGTYSPMGVRTAA